MTIYTTGYTGKKPADLKAEVDSRDALLVDIRFSAKSRVAHWQGDALRRLVGASRYAHVPNLGNVNYKTGGEIVIADARKGIEWIERQQRTFIPICACKEFDRCHRKVVAQALELRGHTVRELDTASEPRLFQ